MLDLFIALLMGLFSGNGQHATTPLNATALEQQAYENPHSVGKI